MCGGGGCFIDYTKYSPFSVAYMWILVGMAGENVGNNNGNNYGNNNGNNYGNNYGNNRETLPNPSHPTITPTNTPSSIEIPSDPLYDL